MFVVSAILTINQLIKLDMKLVLTKQLLLTTAILLAGTACTNENNEGLLSNPSSPSDGDATNRREVVVTIKNKLTVTPTGTKAGEIATAKENKISSLDIYVFGAETADGTYTFQERFAYREDPTVTPMPAGATSIDLTQEGDGKEASVSMKLKKGLFVKLYAIANQTSLVDPTGTIGTGIAVGAPAKLMLDGDFKPLVLTNPEQQGTTVLTVGVPTEEQFLKFHSPLLDAATPEDILDTPLPMSGANTVPTDLTDFEAFARIQASFKLTRTVARFDVVNNAADSRFTISNISMGNARKGTTFFPIAPVGTAPADLITMPARTFTGLAGANTGTTPAAFYSYPSPKDDDGYIILTGKYKMNNTDVGTDVSYQIPFKQEVNGNGSYIEISPNHRYTIAITKADDYHLDFNLTVADWTDEGDMDGFEPTEPTLPVTFNTPSATNKDGNPITETGVGKPFEIKADDPTMLRIEHCSSGTQTISLPISNLPAGVEPTAAVAYITAENDVYETKNWLTSTITPDTKADANSHICQIQITRSYSGEVMRQDMAVQIGTVTISWGEGDDKKKTYTIYHGDAFVTYVTSQGQPLLSASLYHDNVSGKDIWWAPVDCGVTGVYSETPFGRLYQWGRKTEFARDNNNIYAGSNYPSSITASYAGEWENLFIKGNLDDNNSWIDTNTPGLDKAWNNNGKTANDPCPDGWRIPTQEELKIFVNGSYRWGSLSTGGVYLPDGQTRLHDTGETTGKAKFWTSDYKNGKACYLSFDNAGDNGTMHDDGDLANGCYIRCIKE